MLSIVLFILKFIGITLLVILGIVLLIIASVLFVPIRYRLDGAFLDEKKRGEVQVSWAGPVIKAKAGYEYGKEFFYFIRILGITMLASGDQKTIFTRISDWKRKRKEKKYKKEQKKQEKRKKEKNIEEPVFLPEPEKLNQTDRNTSVQKNDLNEKEEGYPDKRVDDMDDLDGIDPVPYGEVSLKPSNHLKSKNKQKTVEEPKERWYNKIIKIIAGIPGRIKHILDAGEDFKDKFEEKSEDLYDKYEALERFYYKKQTNDVMQKMMGLVQRTIFYVLPVRYRGHLRYGFSDPSITGKTYGILCMLGITLRKGFQINPDFQEAALEGDISIRGRIRIFYFVRIAVILFFDKQLKAVYKEGKAVIGGIRS